MTEAEWLNTDDVAAMLLALRECRMVDSEQVGEPPHVTDRKLRLFSCACYIAAGRWTPEESSVFQEDGHHGSHLANVWANKDGYKFLPAATQAAMLRDVIGNPWQSNVVALPCPRCGRRGRDCLCDWLTPTVLGIAQRIYSDRDFAAMPILADALEEAGCEDEIIMRHCRGEEPCPTGCRKVGSEYLVNGNRCPSCHGSSGLVTPLHVRGCWVVDLILGKQ